MPAPKGGAIFSWLPNTPSINIGATTIKVSGNGKGKNLHSHPIAIVYPYGAQGYKDGKLTAVSSNKDELSSIKMAAADTGAAARVMSFVIKTNAKTATYKITIEAKSSKTGLKSSSVLTINFVKVTALGNGGSEDLLSPGAIEFIRKKVGVGSPGSWELCYSAAKHGWGSSNFRERCLNKGPLFVVHKRKKNGRIIGGNVHLNFYDNGGYIQTSTTEPKAWLYRILPNAPDKVEIARKYHGVSHGRHTYYPDNSNYLMCWGGGHDLCCRSDGYCWSHMGHDYRLVPPPPLGFVESSVFPGGGGLLGFRPRSIRMAPNCTFNFSPQNHQKLR